MLKIKTSRVHALTLAALALAAMLTEASAQTRSYINPNHASQPDALPFSGAVLTGNTLYISGTLGLENGKVPVYPAAEARNALNEIKAQLEAADMTMDDLSFVQIFCSDLSLYQVFNDVYRTFFTQEFPSRAFIGAGSLLFDARFEIQAIAVKRD